MLTIAGLPVRIRSRHPLVREPNRGYLSFLAPDPIMGISDPAIDVEVLVSPAPVNGTAPIFDSDVSWNMQPEGEGYRISFRRQDDSSAHTVLCCDRTTTRVQVYTEQDRLLANPAAGVADPVTYPVDQLLFMNHLALRGGVICHAAAAALDDGALLFAGVSGAGKTTISEFFEAAGLGDRLLSDDRVILLRSSDDGQETVIAWGTPWHGDARIAQNASAPLAAILFLTKAATDVVVPIAPAEAMRRLMPVVSAPWYDPERLPAVLETCGRIVESVPCYDLHFTLGGEVVNLLTAGRRAPSG